MKKVLIMMAIGMMTSSFAQCYTVNLVPPPAATLNCGAIYATLTPVISPPTGALSFSWQCPPGANVSGTNTGTLLTNAVGIYTVIVGNTTNTCVATATMQVVQGQLTAGFAASSFTNAQSTVNFTNTSTSSSGTLNMTSLWNFGNGSSQTTTANINTYAVYTSPGTYTVTLTVAMGSCISTFTALVYPGISGQAWLGIEELTPNEEVKKYFDFTGKEQAAEKGKLLIEQVGNFRRKVIITD